MLKDEAERFAKAAEECGWMAEPIVDRETWLGTDVYSVSGIVENRVATVIDSIRAVGASGLGVVEFHHKRYAETLATA